jgi:hypothetical protein
VSCYLACGWSPSCLSGCNETAGDAAAWQMSALDECAKTCERTNTVSYFNCAFQGCPDEVRACMPTGPDTCYAVSLCVSGCKKDAACQARCVANATFASQRLYFSVVQCVVTNCPTDVGELVCQGTKCRKEVDACVGDK